VSPPSSNSAVAAEASLFQGLFGVVTLNETSRAELLRLGVDPARLETKYRVDVWGLELVANAGGRCV
jgi:hypothetical protein